MGPALDTRMLQLIDCWVGMCICGVLTVVRAFGDGRNQPRHSPKKILFVKFAEQGSTVLAFGAISRAIQMVGRQNVYFLVFEEMEKEGKLDIRISEWLPFRAPLDELKKMRAHHDQNDPMLHTGMLKGFMDGSLGSRRAVRFPASVNAPL